jgi:hypothetical protein
MSDNGLPTKIAELTETEKRAIVLQALEKEGYNDSQASQLMGVSRARVSQVNKKIKSGKLSPLFKKGTIKKVRENLEKLIDGQPVGTMASVKGADILGAMKMIADRVDPVVVKTENTNTSRKEITPEDTAKFRKLLGLPVVDAEFQIVEQKQIEQKVETKENEGNKNADN